jgi:hypothetical protein
MSLAVPEGETAMEILVPIVFYALLFAGILILREMAWSDGNQWRG